MTKLYIANCKKQAEDFVYRIPEAIRTYMQNIPAGGQIEVYRDAPMDILEGIVEQHRMYGLVDVKDIDRTKEFANLCYQFDKPITQNQIMYGIEHNSEVLEVRGNEMRKKAAVAINNNLERAAEESGSSSKVNAVEVAIKEEKTDQGDSSSKLDQTVRVAKEGRE